MITKVIVIEYHIIIRNAIIALLESNPKIKVVGATGNLTEALELANKLNPDIAIINSSIPDSIGIKIIMELKKHLEISELNPAQIRALRNEEKLSQEGLAALLGASPETVNRWENGKVKPKGKNLMALLDLCIKSKIIRKSPPSIKILAYSPGDDKAMIEKAIEAGADACIIETSAKEDFFEAIRLLAEGKGYLLQGELPNNRLSLEASTESLNATFVVLSLLTGREREVLTMIAQGLSNKEIAGKLFLSVKTIETHRTHLMEKLGAHEVTALVKFAYRTGLISL